MASNKKFNEELNTTASEFNGFIGVMERIKRFINKEGLKGTFTTLLTLFITVTLAYFIFNPGAVFDKFQQYSQEKHEEGIKQRLEADPQIRALLTSYRIELNADRAYILEAHNGGTNLTNLPFLYADLTYLDPRNQFDYIETEYKNFRLSRYPWASYVIEHGFWFGSINDCVDTDPELFYRLKNEDVAYMGMYVIHGKTGLPSACLGVVYSSESVPKEPRDIIRISQKYSSQINSYLIGK